MADFATEAPPLVELTRHVRSAKGAAFYHKSIGTLLTGNDPEKQYSTQKAKNDAAKQTLARVKAAKRVTSSSSHSDLLAARRAARDKHPVGHPERLAAERAVRASRKSSRNAGQVQSKRKQPAKPPGREHPIVGGAKTSASTTGVGGSFSKSLLTAKDNVGTRLQELNNMTEGERSQYFALRNAGLHHGAAMTKIHERRSRPKATPKVVKAAASRRRRRG